MMSVVDAIVGEKVASERKPVREMSTKEVSEIMLRMGAVDRIFRIYCGRPYICSKKNSRDLWFGLESTCFLARCTIKGCEQPLVDEGMCGGHLAGELVCEAMRDHSVAERSDITFWVNRYFEYSIRRDNVASGNDGSNLWAKQVGEIKRTLLGMGIDLQKITSSVKLRSAKVIKAKENYDFLP